MRQRLLVVLALLSAACISGEYAEPSISAESVPVTETSAVDTGPVQMPAGFWQLVAGAPLVDGHRATLWFVDDPPGGNQAVVGHGPCNSFGSEVELGDGTISVLGISSTGEDCGEPVIGSERDLFRGLQEAETYRLDRGRLIISGPDSELMFEPVPPPPTADIVDRQWILETTVEDGVSTEALGNPAGLILRSDGTASYGMGCETVHGNWEESGPDLLMWAWVSSEDGGCTEELRGQVDEQEALIQRIAGHRYRAVLDGDRLTLSNQGDLLIYRPDTLSQIEPAETGRLVTVPLTDTRTASEVTLEDVTFRFDGFCTVAEDGTRLLLVWPDGHIRMSPRGNSVIFTAPTTDETVLVTNGDVVTIDGIAEIQRTDFTVQPHRSCPLEEVFLVTGIAK